MLKHTQTIRRLLPTNILCVFNHFVALALKRLSWYKSKSTGSHISFMGLNILLKDIDFHNNNASDSSE